MLDASQDRPVLGLEGAHSRVLPPAKSIVTNLTSVIGGELLLRVANFGVMIVLARRYEASTVGMYATALAFSTVAVMLADNGLQVSAIAELSQPQRHPSTVVSRFYISKTLLAVPALALLATLAWLAKLPPAAWIIGALVTVRTAVQSYCQLQLAVLKGLHRIAAIGPVQGIHFAALLMGIGAVYRYHGSVYVLLGWLIAAQSLELLLSGGLLWRAGIRPARFAVAECWSLLWRSEVQASGRPVIAYGRGGALETVAGVFPGDPVRPEETTGVFFAEQTAALTEAMLAFESVESEFSPLVIRKQVERFAAAHFEARFRAFVAEKVAQFNQSRARPQVHAFQEIECLERLQ